MVDNDLAVNINSLWTLQLVALNVPHLKPTSIVVQDFNQNQTKAVKKIYIKLASMR